jgi:hypothetical protein
MSVDYDVANKAYCINLYGDFLECIGYQITFFQANIEQNN